MDTSVWIDHLRGTEPHLQKILNAGKVLMHAMVLGELACGDIPDRAKVLHQMHHLPDIRESAHIDVVSMIETNGLMRKGIGFIDAHLLCSVLENSGTKLWTRDRKLREIAENHGVAYAQGM